MTFKWISVALFWHKEHHWNKSLSARTPQVFSAFHFLLFFFKFLFNLFHKKERNGKRGGRLRLHGRQNSPTNESNLAHAPSLSKVLSCLCGCIRLSDHNGPSTRSGQRPNSYMVASRKAQSLIKKHSFLNNKITR